MVAIFTIWELSKHNQRDDYGYRFISFRKAIYFTLGVDKTTLDAKCEREYVVECLNGSLDSISFSADHMEALFPFTGHEDFAVKLLTESSGIHQFRLVAPHRTKGSQFAFRVYIHPRIAAGEKFTIKVEFMLPHFSVAEKEVFDAMIIQTKTNAYRIHNGCEYVGTYINRPTESLTLEIQFSSECKITPNGFIAPSFKLKRPKQPDKQGR